MNWIDLDIAHRACMHHREQVMQSDTCGCFYCLAQFAPGDITEWCDEGQTAICPRCGIDSVIGSASGYPITSDFLNAMNKRWF